MNETHNREAAWQLLTEFTQSESLRKHALAVEACMRACARKYSPNPSTETVVTENAITEKGAPLLAVVARSGNSDAGSKGFACDEAPKEQDREGHEFTRAAKANSESGASAPEGSTAEELWGIVGLIHDFDYDRYPSLDDHPYKGNAILKERGWPEVISRAVMSHAEYTGIARDSKMEKALFACDELAGFITAVALIKLSKSLAEVDVKSVRKRMKDKAFARKVNRDDIINGAADLGVDLDEHIALCIEAMKGIAGELGLDGRAAKSA
jgi:predicted hydrolase (HD superfamily)